MYKNVPKKILLPIGSIIICAIQLIPFYMMITMSLKKPTDYHSVIQFPLYIYLENYINVWEKANLDVAFTNTLITTFGTLFLLIVVASMAAYPLSRVRTKLNAAVYNTFISCMIIPSLTLMVPLYKFLIDINLLNTLIGAILVKVAFAIPLCIFLYTGFIGGIPKEIDEAGCIDGASPFRVFYQLIFPLLSPVTASVLIVQGIGIWNEYGMSLYILQEKNVQVLTVSLARFIGQNQSHFNWVAAGCLMASIPVIILFLLCQKQFIKGMVSGAVKG